MELLALVIAVPVFLALAWFIGGGIMSWLVPGDRAPGGRASRYDLWRLGTGKGAVSGQDLIDDAIGDMAGPKRRWRRPKKRRHN
jgi:hypothetical protein